MADTERNKHAVARLFEAFRVGDTDAFDDLIVDDYVQHDAQAANGLQAAKDYFAPVGPVDVEVHRVIAEGDLVAVHSNLQDLELGRRRHLPPQRGRQDHRALGRPPAGPSDDG